MKPHQRAAFICGIEGIGPSEKALLFVLSRHVKDDTMSCWMSQATLLRETGIKSKGGLIAATKRVEQAGLLTVQRPPKHAGRGSANTYILTFEQAEMVHGMNHSTTQEWFRSDSGMVQKASTNGSPDGHQPLRTILNRGAAAPARETRTLRRTTPDPSESPAEKHRRQLLDVAKSLRLNQQPGEAEAEFLARVEQCNVRRLSALQ